MHLNELTVKTTPEGTDQIRLMQVGPPGSGKTYSAVTTFPDPYVIDIDRGLTSPDIRILEVKSFPLWDAAYRKTKFNTIKMSECVIKIITESKSLTASSTLILDSISTLSDGVAADLWAVTPLGKDKQPDGYWFWDNWGDWWLGLCQLLNNLQCNVVVNAHESEVRESDSGKLMFFRWLLAGQKFSPRMSQYFTDVFRMKKFATTSGTGQATTVKEEYMWQIKADYQFPFAKTRISSDKLYVPATYKSLATGGK